MAAADAFILTHIEADIEGDTYFPEYDSNSMEKSRVALTFSDDKNAYQLDFSVYEKVIRLVLVDLDIPKKSRLSALFYWVTNKYKMSKV